ncbi:MAG: PAS domain-containing protein, partial [Myxococcota bacterium]
MQTPERVNPPAEDSARLARELHGERLRLEALLAAVPGVVWEAWGAPDKASQRIDYVSEHVTEMLGYTVEEWLATPNFWLSIVHPDDRAEAARVGAETFMAGGAPRTNRFRWLRKDGRAIWVESRAVAILDASGRPIGMRGVNYDIGAQVAAEEQ